MHQIVRFANQLLACLSLTGALLLTQPVLADTLVLRAIEDFPNRSAGNAPYYAEPARSALAINAADPTYRDVFAKATTTFSGPSGEYDVTLIGLAELDGEAPYRFSVNNDLLGVAENPETSVDYMPMAHRFEGITLLAGDVLSVESLANSNDSIPEGDGYAFARGRWTELRLTPAGEDDAQPEKVSLITNASALNSRVSIGDTLAIDYAVINDDSAGATATNLRVQFNIPDNFEITEPNACTAIATTHSNEQIIRCSESQIAPGMATSGQLILTAISAGTRLEIHATSFANEIEAFGADNRATVIIAIGDEDIPDSLDPAVLENEPSAQDAANMGLTLEELANLSEADASEALPESETVQPSDAASPMSESPIMTGGGLGSGTGITLLLFVVANFRRIRQ